MRNVVAWLASGRKVGRHVPVSGNWTAKREDRGTVHPVDTSSRTPNAAERIAWHVAASRESRARVLATPRVPRPRTEEDALSAMNRIKWHARRALPRPRRG